jgi:hypothetical protein
MPSVDSTAAVAPGPVPASKHRAEAQLIFELVLNCHRELSLPAVAVDEAPAWDLVVVPAVI